MVFYINNGRKYFSPWIIESLQREEYIQVFFAIKTMPTCDLIDCHGTTLLHLSAKFNCVCILRYLLDSGSPLNAVNDCSVTPLITAVMNESVESAKLLLEAGSNMYLNCFHGCNALKLATRFRKSKKSVAIVKLFFEKMTRDLAGEYYSDVEIVDRLAKVKCPLYRMIYLANADATKMLINRDYCHVNSQDPDTGNTALHEAVQQRDVKNILVLLENGADIMIRNHAGLTCAVYELAHNIQVLSALVKYQIDWTQADETDRDAMKMGQVLVKGDLPTVKLFLQHYTINFHLRDNYGRTALHYLAENRHQNVLELFKDEQFDLNVLDSGSYAALHYAASSGHADTIEFLCERGADMNLRGYLYCTPLFYAVSQSPLNTYNKQCVEILLAYGADPEHEKDHETLIGTGQRIGTLELIEPIVAHLVMLEHKGQAISPKKMNQINACYVTRGFYDQCHKDIENMKDVKIYASLTYYDFLIKDAFYMTSYVRIPEVVEKLKLDELAYTSYYNRLFRTNFARALEIIRLRDVSFEVLNDALDVTDSDHVVVDYVVRFLNYQDLKHFERYKTKSQEENQ